MPNKVKLLLEKLLLLPFLMDTAFKQTLIQRIQRHLLEYGGFITAFFIVSIFFSTSCAIVLSVLLIALWLLSLQFMTLPAIVKKSHVAAWSLLLLACFIFGLSYGTAVPGRGFTMVMKYRELFFIPVLFSFLTTERYRSWAWKAFIIASILTLLISFLMSFGIIGLNTQGDPAFKSRITHSIFIAFFAFFCAHKACGDDRYARLYLALLLLCGYNLFFVVEGRTGQLIFVMLILLFAIQRLTRKGLLFSVLAIIIFLALFLSFSEKAVRLREGFANTQAYLQPKPEQTESSMGQRYTFWKYSLKLIAEKPLLGHGTGSFAREYQRIANGEHFITEHPHNEFFMIGVQLGLLGLFVYSGFLASQYYCSRKLPNEEKWLAQGVLLSLIITSLFNTPILDHTEGHWFASLIALCFANFQVNDKVI
ncbi:Lipid A core-O-antigen ligase-like enyme [Candidatus Methylobacter favarea]|uniref:Lipid A core-O-antigen ligase-like enyme n=1 Tax=Candidatus Methylobacter favarea TaxID=2707345 RepID=A0A8S0XU44_9GAMM|nr:O-antigen ligase family protein [Candidatus Methylobacter favarea]CAA9892278.1 Lipid A core-O-antigen ligase-like enyme [Candidatus Methylobacter favarea]